MLRSRRQVSPSDSVITVTDYKTTGTVNYVMARAPPSPPFGITADDPMLPTVSSLCLMMDIHITSCHVRVI